MRGKKPSIHTGDFCGSWEVIEYRPHKSLCRCACGRCEKPVSNGNLANGRSVGCQQCGMEETHRKKLGVPTRRVLKNLSTDEYRRLFTIVNNVIGRCANSCHIQWKDYGGRGISVYPLWTEDKWKFIEYLSQLPGYNDPSLLLDRENNDGDYEPGNLRFVTRSVSNYNRRAFPTRHGVLGRFAVKASH